MEKNKSIKVLLIEDNPGDARLIKEMLGEADYINFNLMQAKSLKEAFELLDDQTFDLIMSDLGLPDSQGYDTFVKVHNQAPKLPIIVMTGLDDNTMGTKAVRGGAQDYLIKGQVESNLLVRTIRYAIERKQSDEALRENEQKYRVLFDSSPEAIILVGMDGNILDCNKETEKLIKISKEEIINGQTITIANLFKEDMPKYNKLFSQAEKGEVTDPFEVRTKDIKNETHWYEVFPSLIWDDNRVVSVQIIIRDITERKFAEEALKESEDRYSTLVELSPDGIILADGGNIVFANNIFYEMFGFEESEVKGKNMLKLMAGSCSGVISALSKNERKMLLKNITNEITRKLKPCNYQVPFIKKTGEELWVEVITKPIDYKGKLAEIILVRDISERKRSEEEIKNKNEELQVMGENLRELNLHLEQKVEERTSEIEKLLKHKDEFISQLGHDIKTPLTPLTSLLPVIEKKEIDKKSKELLEICIRNVGYIKNLVINTLKLARLNSLDTVFDIKEIDIFDLVDSVLLDNQTIFKEEDIEIENNLERKTIVFADELRLREVFNNLITNAIKFMEKGGKLTLGMEENTDGFAKISVKDTGIGMDEEVKANLFKEFYKADPSRHELASSGLGLSICKRIVEKHGGKIWAESSGVGKGSTFYFTIKAKNKIVPLSVVGL